MERAGCRLCGSRESFLVNLTEDYHHAVLLNFIASHLNIRLSPGPGCTVCGKCIGGLESWRQLKQSVQSFQNASARHHHNEPPLSSEPEPLQRSPPQSPQERPRWTITQAVSLAPTTGDPLSVVSIKTEADDIPLGSSSSLGDHYLVSATPSCHQIEVDTYSVKQEPYISASPSSSRSVRQGTHVRYSAEDSGGPCTSVDEVPHPFQSPTDRPPTLEAYKRGSHSFEQVSNAGEDVPTQVSKSTPGSSKRVSSTSSKLTPEPRPPGEPKKLGLGARNGNSKFLVIECARCFEIMTTADEMRAHWASVHKVEKLEPVHKNPVYSFVCTLCKKKFTRYNSARTHRKEHQESNDREDEEEDGDSEVEVTDRDEFENKHAENLNKLEADLVRKDRSDSDVSDRKVSDRKEPPPADDKARVAREIRRQALLYAHFRYVQDADNNNSPDDPDANVKIETLESLRTRKVDKTDSLETVCCKLIPPRDRIPLRLHENLETDLQTLGDSKVSLLNVLVKTENIYNDAVEENSDYGQIPMTGTPASATGDLPNSTASNLANSSVTDHFLALASSENPVLSQDSLGDDQPPHTTPSVENNFQCNLCNVYFDTINLLGEHMKGHTLEILKSNYEKGMNLRMEIQCEFCAGLMTVQRFRSHFDKYHSDVTIHTEPELLPDRSTLRCKSCREEFKRSVMFETHMKPCFVNRLIMKQLELVASLKNKDCNSKESIVEIELKQPSRGSSFVQKDFKKPLNDYVLKDSVPVVKRQGYTKRRMDSEEKAWPEQENRPSRPEDVNGYECPECSLKCKTKLRYDIHAVHHGASTSKLNTIQCYDCNLRFTSLCGARNHLKRVHLGVGTSVILCAHCLRTFSSVTKYRTHYGTIEKTAKVQEEETDNANDGNESEEENAQSSEEVLEQLKKSLSDELEEGRQRRVNTRGRLKIDRNRQVASDTGFKTKELKMLNMDTNCAPLQKRPRRELGNNRHRHDVSRHDNQTVETRGRRHVLEARDHARSSSAESGSSSRTSRSNRSSHLTPRELSPEPGTKRKRAEKVIVESEKPSRKRNLEATREKSAAQSESSKSGKATHEVQPQCQEVREDVIYYDQSGGSRKVLTCQHCAMRFITEVVHADHESGCKKGKVSMYRSGGVCVICNIYFSNVSKHLAIHGNLTHRFKTDKKYIYVYQCPICLIDMKQTICKFDQHIKKCKARGSYSKKCKYCKRHFVGASTRTKHQNMCSSKLANEMFKKAKQPLLKCTYCCRHVQISKENHDKYCKEPIEKSRQSQVSTPDSSEEPNVEQKKLDKSSPSTKSSTSVATASEPPKLNEPEIKTSKPESPSVKDSGNKCEKCARTFNLKIAFNKHIVKCQGVSVENQISLEETSVALSCFLCPAVRGSPFVLYNHYKQKHKLVFEDSLSKNQRMYPCLYCKKPCKSFVKFNLHGHFHQKQNQPGQKTRRHSVQEEDKTEESHPELTPIARRDKPAPLSVKTRDRSKVDVEKPLKTPLTPKENLVKSSLVESVLTTRSGTHVRTPVEDSTGKTQPSVEWKSPDKSSLDKDRKGKSLTENAKIMNSYKSRKSKKRTKCESCKEFIVNTYYTQHAVLCIRKTKNKRHCKGGIMSGYVKRKKNSPSQMLCIYCKQYINTYMFNSHSLKCERKNSYRYQQKAEGDRRGSTEEPSVSQVVKLTSSTVKLIGQAVKSAATVVKPTSQSVSHAVKPTNQTGKLPSLAVKQASLTVKPTSQLVQQTNSASLTVKPANQLVRQTNQVLKSPSLTVKPSNQLVKSTTTTNPFSKTNNSPLKLSAPVKAGCQIIEVISLDDDENVVDHPKLIANKPQLTITKVINTPDSSQSKPGGKRVESTSKVPTIEKVGPSIKPQETTRKHSITNVLMNTTGTRQPKPGGKSVESTSKVPTVEKVGPSIKPQETTRKHRRKSPLGDRTKMNQPLVRPNVVQCPLCFEDLHKRSAASHYWYYHIKEVEHLSLYIELLGLKDELGRIDLRKGIFCPVCEKTYTRDAMQTHYPTHKNSRSEFKNSIKLLGFRNEHEFVDYIENKHDLVTRSKPVRSDPEVIDLVGTSSPPSSILTRKKTADSPSFFRQSVGDSKRVSNAQKKSVEPRSYQSLAESSKLSAKNTPTSLTKRSRSLAEPQEQPRPERSMRTRDRLKPVDALVDQNRERLKPIGDSLDENLSLADLMTVRGLKRSRKDNKERNEDTQAQTTQRLKRTKHKLETSDPIILNEDDSGDTSECEDPLADPFGACQDSDKLSVEPPYRSYTTDEESGIMECDLTGLEDWESLENKSSDKSGDKSGDQHTEDPDVSSHEIEKKHQLARNIHSQIAERIQAALNKNSSQVQAKKLLEEKNKAALNKTTSEAQAKTQQSVPASNTSPQPQEKLASLTEISVKRTQSEDENSRRPSTSGPLTKTITILQSNKTVVVSTKLNSAASFSSKPEPVSSAAKSIERAYQAPSNASISKKAEKEKHNERSPPTYQLKKNADSPTEPSKKEAPRANKHRVELKVAPRPADTMRQSFAKAEKVKNKLLLKFKKEKSQNSYSVYHKTHGPSTSRTDSAKKSFTERPRHKEFIMNHVGKKHADHNLTKKLREVKITKRRPDELCRNNALLSKVQSIAREVKASLEKSATSNERESEHASATPDTIGTPVNDEGASGNSSVPANETSSSKPFAHEQASSEPRTTSGGEAGTVDSAGASDSKPPHRVTFSATFVSAMSPPPENTTPCEAPSAEPLQAPGSPLFPPPPSHLATTERPPSPTSYAVAQASPQETSVRTIPKSPDSPPMFPTAKAVGVPPQQLLNVISTASHPTPVHTNVAETVHPSHPPSQDVSVQKGNVVFEIKHGARSNTSYQDAQISSRVTPPTQSSVYSNVTSSSLSQSTVQNTYTPVPSQKLNVQYPTPNDYIEYPKPSVPLATSTPHCVEYPKSSSHSTPSPSYTEYPKPSPLSYAQRSSTPNTPCANTEVHSNPASPMYAVVSHPSPAPSYEGSPSSSRPASRSITPGGVLPSPSSTESFSSLPAKSPSNVFPDRTTGQTYTATSAAQQTMKLPPVSSLVYRNSNYPYPSNMSSPYQESTPSPYRDQSIPSPYRDQSTPSPYHVHTPPPNQELSEVKSYSYSPNYSPQSNLTDNLLSIPTLQKRPQQDNRSSVLSSPSNSNRSYASPTSFTSPIPKSPSDASLNTSYPLPSAYAAPVSSVTTAVSKPKKKSVASTTAYPNYPSTFESPSQPPSPKKKPTTVAASTSTVFPNTSTAYPNYSATYESPNSNLISYPISSAGYSYPATYNPPLCYSTPAAPNYTQSSAGSYISYPPVESHLVPSAEGLAPQGFRPYESPYHSSPIYDYPSAPSYAGGYLPSLPHAGYPPAPGQYTLPRAPSPPPGYYQPPDTY